MSVLLLILLTLLLSTPGIGMHHEGDDLEVVTMNSGQAVNDAAVLTETSPPTGPSSDASSLIQEFQTLCFNLDMNEMAPCVYRRTCDDASLRNAATPGPVEQETCDPWRFGQFLPGDAASS